jgi:hypothetical protein
LVIDESWTEFNEYPLAKKIVILNCHASTSHVKKSKKEKFSLLAGHGPKAEEESKKHFQFRSRSEWSLFPIFEQRIKTIGCNE